MEEHGSLPVPMVLIPAGKARICGASTLSGQTHGGQLSGAEAGVRRRERARTSSGHAVQLLLISLMDMRAAALTPEKQHPSAGAQAEPRWAEESEHPPRADPWLPPGMTVLPGDGGSLPEPAEHLCRSFCFLLRL
ncbi:hypothetical protein FQA47_018632 [Oryzias melastigma]|uniref:Uncharacterized protein n=1 Tax=Oryzias melastigma TaxID=30732 RepID=A0A834C3V2_ORYME|nr:hypothetical protein FQA47_018632 [Oryzias melastigma]